MPIMSCELNGKHGFKWGNSGKCYTEDSPGENKRKAVLQGISYEGSDKVNKILKHGKASITFFGDKESVSLAKAIIYEEENSGPMNRFLSSVASYFGRGDDGQNSSDIDRSGMLDGPSKEDHIKEVDNAGDLSGNPSKTGDGSGNQFVQKGKPSDKLEEDKADDFNGPPFTMSEDKYGKHPNGPDNDGDEPDLEKDIASTNNDASLDKKRDHLGHITISPYNKDASPETDKTPVDDGNAPYNLPTRDEMNHNDSDTRKKKDDKVEYTGSNLYQDEVKKAETVGVPDLKGIGEYSHAEWRVILEHCAYAYVSQEVRDNMDSSDFGWPEEKKYPVKDESHFHAAVKLLGRAPSNKQAMIKRNLIRIAHKKGYKLPDTWTHTDADDFVENAGNQV